MTNEQRNTVAAINHAFGLLDTLPASERKQVITNSRAIDLAAMINQATSERVAIR